jgi:tetratricopeptide (TPR) repeat protein
MIFAVVLSGAFVASATALGGDSNSISAADRAAYRQAASAVGRDPAAQVRLALWCEAHGLSAERTKHLALAVQYDPSNTLARGLLGFALFQGTWRRPEAIEDQLQNDPAVAALTQEYLERRAKAPNKADAQSKLAAWCLEKGLKDAALAHYHVVIQLDPSRESAWKHLGYKKQGRRWVKAEDLAAEKLEAARQKQADKEWGPKLEKLRGDLLSKDPERRARALEGLKEVTDPRAVPMIWTHFVRGNERLQIAAVQLLGQIAGPSASNGLAALAIFSPSESVRSKAIATLRLRDPRDVVGRLIAMMRKPFTYQVRPVRGPGLPGELFVEGERFNVQRFYQNQMYTPMMNMGRFFVPSMAFDPFGVRNIMMATLGTQYALASNYQVGQPVGPGGLAAQFPVSIPPPIMAQSAAQAGRAIAANPQNAATIVNQLTSNPANRSAPPAYWFMLMNQHVSSHPTHDAATLAHLDQAQKNPANQQANAIFDMMLTAEAQAAQRDLAIGLELERVRETNQLLEQRLAMDVQVIESTNQGINQYNERVLPVLAGITGMNLGVEPEKWRAWWTDQLGYSYRSDVPEIKPTYTDFVAASLPLAAMSSCFAAGTLVQTINGPRPIESLRTGDEVLSQDVSSGSLTFEPVLVAHRNSPAATLRITAGGESIIATGIHRFWKAGTGWTMARELKAGDRLRMVGGVVEIESIEAGQTQPVYNLDVAQNRDFFVGTKGLLVHDFSFVQPVVEPFDRPAEVEPAKSPGK